MDNMFAFCSKLTSLDLTNFETSQVTSMQNMFYQCENMEKLNIL